MDSYVLVHNLPILLSLGFSFFSSIGCFRFLGVVADSSGNRFRFRGVADFIRVVGHHNSPCGDLLQEITPIHSFCDVLPSSAGKLLQHRPLSTLMGEWVRIIALH